MKFSGETKVNEIASRILGRAGFLEDAGVDYCCGGSLCMKHVYTRMCQPTRSSTNCGRIASWSTQNKRSGLRGPLRN